MSMGCLLCYLADTVGYRHRKAIDTTEMTRMSLEEDTRNPYSYFHMCTPKRQGCWRGFMLAMV